MKRAEQKKTTYYIQKSVYHKGGQWILVQLLKMHIFKRYEIFAFATSQYI